MESAKYQNSLNLLERAKLVTPIGSQTYSKSYRYFCEGVSPAFIDRGNGCKLWDIDGNEFIDFICALGPITIGYNDDRINKVIKEQLSKGIIFSQPTKVSIELAEKISDIIPCAEMVRFVKNGSDATSAAVRLARAYTGKELILVSGYHGMQDWYIASTTNNKGVPQFTSNLIKNFEYNNIDSLKILIEENKNNISCIIMEPIQSNGPQEGYLEEVRKLATENNIILIFDEVVSGFRYALGGASELYNVIPDMVAIGKGMANGMPISAVAGKRELLELIGSEGVFVSTTFGGEALSIVAALKTIEILSQKGTYEKFWALGSLMKNGLNSLVDKYKLENVINVSGLEPHCGIIFDGIGDLDYLDINSIYQQTLIEDGILTVGINNLSLSHSGIEVEKYLQASEEAFKKILMAINNNSTKNVLKGGKVDPIFKRNIK